MSDIPTPTNVTPLTLKDRQKLMASIIEQFKKLDHSDRLWVEAELDIIKSPAPSPTPVIPDGPTE